MVPPTTTSFCHAQVEEKSKESEVHNRTSVSCRGLEAPVKGDNKLFTVSMVCSAKREDRRRWLEATGLRYISRRSHVCEQPREGHALDRWAHIRLGLIGTIACPTHISPDGYREVLIMYGRGVDASGLPAGLALCPGDVSFATRSM